EVIGGDAFGVLAHQRALAGGDFYFVEIVPGGVAVVYPDVDGIGLGARYRIGNRADALYVGEIACGRDVLSGGRRISRIDRIDVVILVAGFVLNEQYVLAVARPEVSRDRALGVSR